jgi:hypothetical protein
MRNEFSAPYEVLLRDVDQRCRKRVRELPGSSPPPHRIGAVKLMAVALRTSCVRILIPHACPHNGVVDQDKVYQHIGEFVVSFQFIENQIRQIGWLLLDPGKKVWPPKALRKETSEDLADKVATLYHEKLHLCRLPHEEQQRTEFNDLMFRFHKLRRFRNQILHSAFIELKAGGAVMAVMRSNPRLIKDPETGDETTDQEILSENFVQWRDGRDGSGSLRSWAALSPANSLFASRVILIRPSQAARARGAAGHR